MPYVIRKLRNENKYSVKNGDTGTVHSYHTTKAKAEAQVRLLYMVRAKTGSGLGQSKLASSELKKEIEHANKFAIEARATMGVSGEKREPRTAKELREIEEYKSRLPLEGPQITRSDKVVSSKTTKNPQGLRNLGASAVRLHILPSAEEMLIKGHYFNNAIQLAAEERDKRIKKTGIRMSDKKRPPMTREQWNRKESLSQKTTLSDNDKLFLDDLKYNYNPNSEKKHATDYYNEHNRISTVPDAHFGRGLLGGKVIKKGRKYQVITNGIVHAKGTTKKKAFAQQRLLGMLSSGVLVKRDGKLVKSSVKVVKPKVVKVPKVVKPKVTLVEAIKEYEQAFIPKVAELPPHLQARERMLSSIRQPQFLSSIKPPKVIPDALIKAIKEYDKANPEIKQRSWFAKTYPKLPSESVVRKELELMWDLHDLRQHKEHPKGNLEDFRFFNETMSSRTREQAPSLNTKTLSTEERQARVAYRKEQSLLKEMKKLELENKNLAELRDNLLQQELDEMVEEVKTVLERKKKIKEIAKLVKVPPPLPIKPETLKELNQQITYKIPTKVKKFSYKVPLLIESQEDYEKKSQLKIAREEEKKVIEELRPREETIILKPKRLIPKPRKINYEAKAQLTLAREEDLKFFKQEEYYKAWDEAEEEQSFEKKQEEFYKEQEKIKQEEIKRKNAAFTTFVSLKEQEKKQLETDAKRERLAKVEAKVANALHYKKVEEKVEEKVEVKAKKVKEVKEVKKVKKVKEVKVEKDWREGLKLYKYKENEFYIDKKGIIYSTNGSIIGKQIGDDVTYQKMVGTDRYIDFKIKFKQLKEIISGSGKTEKFIKASYKKKSEVNNVNGYALDKSLSSKKNKVFVNPAGKVVIANAGTDSLKDWKNNPSIALGTYKDTKRYKQVEKTQKKAIAKYGQENIENVGHSQSGEALRILAKKGLTNKATALNPAIIGKSHKGVDVIRSSRDLVSAFTPMGKGDKTIKGKTWNPLVEHGASVLSR